MYIIKVNLVGSLNSVEFVKLLDDNGICLNNGFEYSDLIEKFKVEGDGVYELMFGCRGGLESVEKNDEYMSGEELKNSIVFEDDDLCDDEDVLEFYGEIDIVDYFGKDIGDKEKNSIFCIGYFEEDNSMFVSIKN